MNGNATIDSRKTTDQGARGEGAGRKARSEAGDAVPNRYADAPGTGADAGFAMMDQFALALGGAGLPDMFDLAALSAAWRRHMEALSAAARVGMQGAERVARCELAMMEQGMTELSEAMRRLTSAGTPMERAAQCAELSRRGCEQAVANIREVNELIQNSQREAFDLLNQCALATMAEVQGKLGKNDRNPARTELVAASG
ncbi:MAG: phasin family protein [Acetobacteraceae bacterium]